MSDGTARDKVIVHAARRGSPARGACQRAEQKATVGLAHDGTTASGVGCWPLSIPSLTDWSLLIFGLAPFEILTGRKVAAVRSP